MVAAVRGPCRFPTDLKVMPCDPHPESAGGGGGGSACFPKCTGSSGDPDSYSGVRNLAFIGGGIRLFDLDVDFFPTNWEQFYKDGFKNALNGTFLLALDVRPAPMRSGTYGRRYTGQARPQATSLTRREASPPVRTFKSPTPCRTLSRWTSGTKTPLH